MDDIEIVKESIIRREESRESQLQMENTLFRLLLSCVLSGRVAYHPRNKCHFVVDGHLTHVIPAIVERNPTGYWNIFHERPALESTNLLPAAEPQPVLPEQQTKTQS